ncbi:MAG: ABC transporter substrate-binding protein [Deltaproteobacteria bacterium]|nr:ABC transporter substrate-binding protein [Deltaproteobacteria bacterium]
MNRPVAYVIAVLVASLLLSSPPASAEDGVPNPLRIGSEGAYPPFNVVDPSGQLKGFDIDIALALCERLKVECKLVAQDWDGIIPALLAGKYDAIVASMSITTERKKVVGFTDKYYSNKVRFVAAKEGGFDPGNLAGKTIGAQRATVSASWLEKNAGGAEIKLYDTQTNAYLDLSARRLDAIFADGLVLHEWLKTKAGAGFMLVGDAYDLDEGIGIAVRKKDDALRQRLNTALAAILADGTYAKINARYFPFSIY